MRILHVIPSMGPVRGGPSAVLRTLARWQSIRGAEVDVVTTDDDGSGRLPAGSETSAPEHPFRLRIFPRQTRFYTFSFPLTRWLWKHSSEYDVIHIHAMFSYPSFIAAICARRASVPYVVRPLGTLNQWGMHNRRRWLKRLSFRWIESRILRNAAAVHYTSDQEALEASWLRVPHRSVIIPNPVDSFAPVRVRGAFRRRYPALAGKTMVLFLSRIDPKKGLDVLLPAFAAVRAKDHRAVLVIAGDGEPAYVSALQLHARRLELDDAIVWCDFLAGDDKRNALADADLYVLPSYSENFGVSVVEAMGAGIPVIVSDQVGIHREIMQAGAGLVTGCSVDALASALSSAIEDGAWRATAAENAIRLAARFSPEIIADRLAGLYEQIRIKNDHPAAA